MLLSEGTDVGRLADKNKIGEGLALDLGGGEEGARVPSFREDDGTMTITSTVFQFLGNVSHTSSKIKWVNNDEGIMAESAKKYKGS